MGLIRWARQMVVEEVRDSSRGSGGRALGKCEWPGMLPWLEKAWWAFPDWSSNLNSADR